jgi:hypothetical protein
MSDDLARRAVACRHWRWLPGMQTLPLPAYGLPDLSDPATVGALLALVREAWGDPGASVWHDRRVSVWSWMADGCIHGVWRPSDADGYETEAEALVAALEAAP